MGLRAVQVLCMGYELHQSYIHVSTMMVAEGLLLASGALMLIEIVFSVCFTRTT